MKILLIRVDFHNFKVGICIALRGVWGEFVAEGF